MRQKTFKPEDYLKLIKSDYRDIGFTTLKLICNNFNMLSKKDKNKVLKLLNDAKVIKKLQEKKDNSIKNLDKLKFTKELEIIEIFQRNDI